MWPTWNTIAMSWRRLSLVFVVCMSLCVSACTALGQSSAHPSTSSEGEYVGPKHSGNGGNGY
jgi:hypothetical protein